MQPFYIVETKTAFRKMCKIMSCSGRCRLILGQIILQSGARRLREWVFVWESKRESGEWIWQKQRKVYISARTAGTRR